MIPDARKRELETITREEPINRAGNSNALNADEYWLNKTISSALIGMFIFWSGYFLLNNFKDCIINCPKCSLIGAGLGGVICVTLYLLKIVKGK